MKVCSTTCGGGGVMSRALPFSPTQHHRVGAFPRHKHIETFTKHRFIPQITLLVEGKGRIFTENNQKREDYSTKLQRNRERAVQRSSSSR